MSKRLTPAQKQAQQKYLLQVRSLDMFLGSVFVTPKLLAEREAEVRQAKEACIALGLTEE
jgi:hypothetical protein